MCRALLKNSTQQCSRKDEPYCWQHDPEKKKVRKSTKQNKKKDGFIYVYRHKGETKSYYKIGHTTRELLKRIKEWERVDGKKEIKIVFAFYTENSALIEKRIHKLLDQYRVYRYYIEQEDTYCTVHKATGDPVFSKDRKLKRKYKLQGSKKRVEWFLADLKFDILPVIKKEVFKF